MKSQECKVTIWRNNPDETRGEYPETFRIPYDPRWSVLQALEYIYQHLDASVAYRGSCGCGFCGVCQMVINGKVRMACREPISPTLDIRPLRQEGLVRDLVVEEKT